MPDANPNELLTAMRLAATEVNELTGVMVPEHTSPGWLQLAGAARTLAARWSEIDGHMAASRQPPAAWPVPGEVVDADIHTAECDQPGGECWCKAAQVAAAQVAMVTLTVQMWEQQAKRLRATCRPAHDVLASLLETCAGQARAGLAIGQLGA